jgi:4-cresol dehydrogenase (hydroxylating) flavoprotein subunit
MLETPDIDGGARWQPRSLPKCGKHAYGEYPAHLDFMDVAAEQYSFGDRAYMRFVETIKDAVDPNGILSPGKQGIWPRPYRKPVEA